VTDAVRTGWVATLEPTPRRALSGTHPYALSLRSPRRRSTALAVGALIALAACTTATSTADAPTSAARNGPRIQPSPPANTPGEDLEIKWPIKHVVIVMQENRSFDHMFGTFPDAEIFAPLTVARFKRA
jgi:phospholipase C